MKPVLIAFLLCLGSALYGQYGHTYVENRGQWPDQVLYRTSVGNGFVWVEREGLRVDLRDYSEVSALHANPSGDLYSATLKGHTYFIAFGTTVQNSEARFAEVTTYNYFQGRDASQWAGGCKGYGEVVLKDVYPGIDLKLYSNEYFLKSDWVVYSPADPATIQLTYQGVDNLELEHGRLAVLTSLGTQYEQQPIAHSQSKSLTSPVWDGEQQRKTAVHYTLLEQTLSYQATPPVAGERLVIDPELIFSTYSGSTADNFGYTATFDEDGNLYSGSSIFGDGYPTTLGAYQVTWAGGDGQGTLAGTDIAITKYSTDGTTRIYSTYLGGAADELPHSLVCAPNGELVLMGTTSSDNFPITAGAYQELFAGGLSFAPTGVGVDYLNGSDMVVTRFAADGESLVGSTYLGGTDNDGVNTATTLKHNYADEMRGEVELDPTTGSVIVVSCSNSYDFPNTTSWGDPVGYQNGTISVLDPNLTALEWSSIVGGDGATAYYSMDIASDGSYFVCGGTDTQSFEVPPGGYQDDYQGGTVDGIVFHLASDGSAVIAGTFFGSSSYDQTYFLELDGEDNPHVFGQTQAPGNFWINNAAYGQEDSGLVVAKLSNDLGSLEWSTVVGTGSGNPNLSPTAFLIDFCGLVYLSGWGGTTNTASNPTGTDLVTGLPVTPDAYQSTTDGSDFYLMVLTPEADELVYATFFGGAVSSEHVDGGTSRFNDQGVVYQSVCAGCDGNSDFPIFPSDAVSPTNNSSNCNNGVFKFQFNVAPVTALFSAPSIGCVDAELQFTNQSVNASAYLWDFGDNTTSELENPTHSYSQPGTYSVSLTAFNVECGFEETYTIDVVVSDLVPGVTNATADPVYLNEGESSQLEVTPGGYSYEWSPPSTLDNAFVQDPIATPAESTTYWVLVSDGECSVLDSVRVFINELQCGDPFIFLPNAFSPNGDGENDALYVRGENIASLYLTIYDRWGEMVFETRDQLKAWDGTYQGQPVDPAVFVYYLEVFCIDGQEYFEEGNVTVIR